MIIILVISFAIFVANAVFLGGVRKALVSPDNTLKLSPGAAEAFLWIDILIAIAIGAVIIFLAYKMIKEAKVARIMKDDSVHELSEPTKLSYEQNKGIGSQIEVETNPFASG